jgi:tRNA (uracil-5-)-methyltransferase
VNGVDNIFIARMSSEEFTSTWKVKGTRERLKGLDWEELRLTTLLVDPPRAGLDADTVQLLKEFEQVLYISCNPETLAANLREVMDSHEIVQMAAFDQFPYTHHLECGVLLRRRQT